MNEKRAPVVILAAGSNITTLALARCFRGTGIPVLCVDLDGGANLLRSARSIQETFSIGTLTSSSNRFLNRFLDLADRLKRDWGQRLLLFPTEDTGLRFCVDQFDEFKKRFVVLGDTEERDVAKFFDKGRFFSMLSGEVAVCPWTRFFDSKDMLFQSADEIPFPVVVKPARKDIHLTFQKRFGAKLALAESFSALQRIFEDWLPTDGVVLQELLSHKEGDEVCWCGYRSREGRITGMTVRELRKYPRIGGTATFVRSEEIPRLHEYASQILNSMDFWGICELEFLPKQGAYKILECNARPWLQIGLALEAGLNVPLLAYSDIDGVDYNLPAGKPKENIYWMSPEYDALRCLFGDKKRRLFANLLEWRRDLRRADDIGLWDLKEPRLVAARLSSYPGKLWKHRSLFRAR
ncbi:MAG: hypothetical protein GTO51_08015 [Candidatus Latescibacteria bacterium]|nr:hypothetical protein [Candidatus Latescibacterota bacterium]NIM21779.1 hypothetical protein [Candidatus Latescibacterota bacterium]NIM65917.1 hypothetical protein [Candidatus Latescibacterota bacterium]NIO02662.1 hypothetical protein [Candidatus Latescibacterota bacterium]NIO29643.1 hypothetical protein [Candidatus Latescibacterota bacterium]